MYNDDKVNPLYIKFPKTSTFVKSLIKDDDLLEQYNAIWDKVSADMKKEFDSEPVCNKEFLKTKIKSHGDEVTDFYFKEIPKVDSKLTCLAVISLDFAQKR